MKKVSKLFLGSVASMTLASVAVPAYSTIASAEEAADTSQDIMQATQSAEEATDTSQDTMQATQSTEEAADTSQNTMQPTQISGVAIIRYHDTEGNELRPDYSQTFERGSDAQATAPEIEGYRLAEGQSAAVTLDTNAMATSHTFKYVRIEDNGSEIPDTVNATVRHEDTEGNLLRPDLQYTFERGSDAYARSLEIEGYRLVEGAASNVKLDTNVATPFHVFVYEEIEDEEPEAPDTVDALIRYHDTEGNELREDEWQTFERGSEAQAIAPDIEGYRLAEGQSAAVTLDTNVGTPNHTFVYEVIPEAPETVSALVRHEDTEGNLLHPELTYTLERGSDAYVRALEFEGYRLAEGQESNVKLDTSVATPYHVFVYEEIEDEEPEAPETVRALVRHEDTEGNLLHPELTYTLERGSDAYVRALDIEGYRLVEGAESNVKLDTTVGTPYHVFVYEEIEEEPEVPETVRALVRHVDTEGNLLRPELWYTLEGGSDAYVRALDIEGYRLAEGQESNVKLDTSVATPYHVFVYEEIEEEPEVPETVRALVRHEDTEGNLLRPELWYTLERGSDAYVRALDIEGYRLVEGAESNVKLDTTVGTPYHVFVYEEIEDEEPEVPGTVRALVRHEDTEGNLLRPELWYTLERGSDAYVRALDIEGYRLAEGQESNVKLDTTVGTPYHVFVYEEIEEEPEVPETVRALVRHVDTEGNLLRPELWYTLERGSDAYVRALDIEGYRLAEGQESNVKLDTTVATPYHVFVYEEIEEEPEVPETVRALVRHEDTDGNLLRPELWYTLERGSDAYVRALDIEGYRLVKGQASLVKLDTTVTTPYHVFVYEKVKAQDPGKDKDHDDKGKDHDDKGKDHDDKGKDHDHGKDKHHGKDKYHGKRKDHYHGKKDKYYGDKEVAKVKATEKVENTANRVAAELPETGETSNTVIFGAAALSILAGLGLIAPKFKKED